MMFGTSEKLGMLPILLSLTSLLTVGLTQTNSTNTSSVPSMIQLSSDSEFHFVLLEQLSEAPYGGSDIGEVLTAGAQIAPGNFESWYNAFYALATRVYATAQNLDPYRYPISARDAMFRASTYFRASDFFLHGNPSDPRINSLWVQQAAAFNVAMSLLDVPGKRVVLQGDNFTIPTIWFGASGVNTRRPTVIIGNGYDGAMEESYHQMGKAALERGYNVIMYEGPGQPTPRREQNLGFIPDWEQVVTPVVDYLITLPGVDPDAIALVGFSFGGYLAPRAAAFDHRLVALLAIDGLFDFGAVFLRQFPANLTALFESGNKTAFDKIMAEVINAPSTSTQLQWTFDQGMWSFDTTSYWDFLNQTQAYTLEGVVNKIPGPVFVASAQDDIFFQGQPEQLAAKLGSKATYHQFLTADGEGEHCALGAQVAQNIVALDWLQDVLDGKI